jgi:Polyketide cyclase / dehydrase and lipid transport
LRVWTCEFSFETAASADAIFAVYRDVAGWPRWDAGLDRMELDGPFAAGTTATMFVAGQDPLPMRLIWVEDGRGFEDETQVPDAGVVVRVRHSLEPRADGGGTRIVHSMTIDGPNADHVGPSLGPAITADFPQTMAAIARLAEVAPLRP